MYNSSVGGGNFTTAKSIPVWRGNRVERVTRVSDSVQPASKPTGDWEMIRKVQWILSNHPTVREV